MEDKGANVDPWFLTSLSWRTLFARPFPDPPAIIDSGSFWKTCLLSERAPMPYRGSTQAHTHTQKAFYSRLKKKKKILHTLRIKKDGRKNKDKDNVIFWGERERDKHLKDDILRKDLHQSLNKNDKNKNKTLFALNKSNSLLRRWPARLRRANPNPNPHPHLHDFEEQTVATNNRYGVELVKVRRLLQTCVTPMEKERERESSKKLDINRGLNELSWPSPLPKTLKNRKK